MCNDYLLLVELASIAEDFDNLSIKMKTLDGPPNVAAHEDIRITDMTPIVRFNEGPRGSAELINRRWGWPGPRDKPVYNFRSEGRGFSTHRCPNLADGFYEFTDPAEPKQKRLDKWLFTMANHRWFCIAAPGVRARQVRPSPCSLRMQAQMSPPILTGGSFPCRWPRQTGRRLTGLSDRCAPRAGLPQTAAPVQSAAFKPI